MCKSSWRVTPAAERGPRGPGLLINEGKANGAASDSCRPAAVAGESATAASSKQQDANRRGLSAAWEVKYVSQVDASAEEEKKNPTLA